MATLWKRRLAFDQGEVIFWQLWTRWGPLRALHNGKCAISVLWEVGLGISANIGSSMLWGSVVCSLVFLWLGRLGGRQQLIRLEWGFPCWALFCRCSSYHESWPAKWPMAWHLHQHHIDSFKSVKSLLRTISNSTFIDFFECCEIFSSDITLRHLHHQRQTFKHLHSQLGIMYTV